MIFGRRRSSPSGQPDTPEIRTVQIRDDAIRLGQLLKLADLADDGTEAKELIAGGQVLVNGEVETRRGRQLVVGETVTVRGQTVGIEAREH
jgi:ribosome-associated protein